MSIEKFEFKVGNLVREKSVEHKSPEPIGVVMGVIDNSSGPNHIGVSYPCDAFQMRWIDANGLVLINPASFKVPHGFRFGDGVLIEDELGGVQRYMVRGYDDLGFVLVESGNSRFWTRCHNLRPGIPFKVGEGVICYSGKACVECPRFSIVDDIGIIEQIAGNVATVRFISGVVDVRAYGLRRVLKPVRDATTTASTFLDHGTQRACLVDSKSASVNDRLSELEGHVAVLQAWVKDSKKELTELSKFVAKMDEATTGIGESLIKYFSSAK
jgi:hypothetical protein